jgi:hypothetical protein
MAPRASQGKKAKKKAKSPRCKTCNQTIRVPKGWTAGPAVRRHYWAKHRDVMQGKAGS